MKVAIQINCDNDAFKPDYRIEVSLILQSLGQMLGKGQALPVTIRDSNGNMVGWAEEIPTPGRLDHGLTTRERAAYQGVQIIGTPLHIEDDS